MKETQVATVHGCGDALLQAGFVEGGPASPQRLNSPFIYVQPSDVMTRGSQPSGGHRTQVPEADDRNLQLVLLVQRRPFLALV